MDCLEIAYKEWLISCQADRVIAHSLSCLSPDCEIKQNGECSVSPEFKVCFWGSRGLTAFARTCCFLMKRISVRPHQFSLRPVLPHQTIHRSPMGLLDLSLFKTPAVKNPLQAARYISRYVCVRWYPLMNLALFYTGFRWGGISQ